MPFSATLNQMDGCCMPCRVQQLRQESSRSRQHCVELDALISRAAAIMDQLASNC